MPPNCGDGRWESGIEDCDDGNKDGGDGCTPGCRVEADWECPEGTTCHSTAICGNGILNSTEGCDDMNVDAGDGCAADCSAVEDGFVCRLPGKPCVPLCGDGRMIGTERCDDGNQNNDDGCSVACLEEPGWSCTGMPSTCVQSVCGNGAMEAGEGCDAGPLNGLFNGDGSGCSKTCTKEPSCRDAAGTTHACDAVCGDANIDTAAGEGCDDGNALDGDGCSALCQPENGFTCTEMMAADTATCSSGTGQCLILPITFRDFDGQNVTGTGHPDFFYLGGSTTCVPNASGREVALNDTCWDSDSTPLCKGIAADALGPGGKPVLGATSMCACRFTDWDNTGILDSVATATTCNAGAANPRRLETMVRVVSSADSFREWYADSTKSTKVVSNIELQAIGNDYQFSSSGGRTVYTDLHDIFMGTTIPAVNGVAANTLSSGFFPLETQTMIGSTKLCNLWPYWTAANDPTCIATDNNPVWQQWDPQGSYTAGEAGTGGPVKPVTGNERNFYFTSEIRYLFRYGGSGSLAFYGDDDVWVYINGKLVLDLGAPHERLQGTVTMQGAGASWTILTTDVTGAAVPPVTGGSGTIPDLGLETGKTYEIVVFHADRHPRESNYQLTLSAFPTTKTSCEPSCGDGVVTAAEECDLGAENMPPEMAYNSCTTSCKWGPFCGDNILDAVEECDLGRNNTAKYGNEGCAADCTLPSRCGDAIVDGAFGETCDDGVANGTAASKCDGACVLISL